MLRCLEPIVVLCWARKSRSSVRLLARSCKRQIRQYLRLAHDCTLHPVDFELVSASVSALSPPLDERTVRSCPIVGTVQELRLLVGVKASKGAPLFIAVCVSMNSVGENHQMNCRPADVFPRKLRSLTAGGGKGGKAHKAAQFSLSCLNFVFHAGLSDYRNCGAKRRKPTPRNELITH